METLVVVIIILVAVLSTPLSLKKLIDHANRHKAAEQNQENPTGAKPGNLPEGASGNPPCGSPLEKPADQSAGKWDDWEDPWND